MTFLDRFSTHLKDVLARAIQLAVEFNHAAVEPIHLLFALTKEQGSVGQEILGRFKLDSKSLETSLKKITSVGTPHQYNQTSLLAVGVLTPLSNKTKEVLEQTLQIAQQSGHSYVGTEHLLRALLRGQDSLIDEYLQSHKISSEQVTKQTDNALGNASHFPQIAEMIEVAERLHDNLSDAIGADPLMLKTDSKKQGSQKKESALDFFAINLTSKQNQQNIDPVIGRDNEISRLIQILSRRTKNNPLLLGEPGVGKTAIVEGLAKLILVGNVPDILAQKKIYALDMSLLISGAIYRGEFEGRLKQVIDEVVNNPEIILFIDEVHNIVGAGSNQGTMDAANILKPALARGQIRCIGATTPAEYKKYIEQDAALERRFQPLVVSEPSLTATESILAGIKENYEKYHNVTITKEAVTAAVKLSDRFITSQFLPDKAIDLMDETAAAKRVKAKRTFTEKKLWELEKELEEITLLKEKAADAERFNDAVNLKKQEAELTLDIKNLKEKTLDKRKKSIGKISEKDVAKQVSKIIGNSPGELLQNGKEQAKFLETELKKYIIGQNHIIKKVAAAVRQSSLGLSSPYRPLASFLFVGQSGVGKTELAKQLARILYQDKDALIKLDMSEFSESYSTSKLLGSPAGYVGFKESNQFTDKLKLRPYSIILFDEIDKAHNSVIKLLLQTLENGEITDSAGKKISLKHAIIVLTTSYGSDTLKNGALGFGKEAGNKQDAEMKLLEKLKEYFSPETINRLDAICFFNSLSKSDLAKIAALEIIEINKQLTPYRTAVTYNSGVLQQLVKQLPNKSTTPREIRRKLRNQIEALLSEIILSKKIKQNYSLGLKDKILELR